MVIWRYVFIEQVEFTVSEMFFFSDDFGCFSFGRSVLLERGVIVECLGEEGRERQLLLVRDEFVEKLVPFDPGLGLEERPELGGNRDYFLSIFPDRIEIKQLNFNFLEISNQRIGNPSIQLMCKGEERETHYYLIEVVSAQLGEVYNNQPISLLQDKILYN